jgi:HSP20 family protein
MLSLINRRRVPNEEDVPAVFRAFDDMFQQVLAGPVSSRPWIPAVDIVENPNELVVAADLPGIKKEDVDVQIEDGTLTLTGSRNFEHEDNKEGYHRLERSYGSFRRAFTLPDSVDSDKVAAAFEDGVLKITLPKKEVAKPRTIKVEVAKK